MTEKDEGLFPFFSSPLKKENSDAKKSIGIFDSSSERIKSKEKNPFTTFINSESMGKSSSRVDHAEKEEFREEQEGFSDSMIKNWEILNAKKKKIRKERQENELCFTRRERKKKRLGKLMHRNLNEKNSKHLIYDKIERRTVSIAYCESCQMVFENFPALGGHRRICKEIERREKNSTKEKEKDLLQL